MANSFPKNSYHQIIKKTLSNIGKNNSDKFLGNFPGNRKIEINHPTKSRTSITYYPDFVLTTKQGHYFIFQVLDSQSEHKDRTVANVINAYLSEQVKRLYFIVQTKKIETEVNEIAEVILKKIEDLSKENTIRSALHVHYIVIPKSTDETKIEKLLCDIIFKVPKKIAEDIKKFKVDDTVSINITVKNNDKM